MNSSDFCHEVVDCPGLYVDAFRGHFLRRTQDPDSAFILTHYHGDHYQNLPREGKYQGPALIHCTPTTAALLIQVHEVPSRFVVKHEYGQEFEYVIKDRKRQQPQQRARIVFYDANHCPGACIVLIQLPNGKVHLHTGDMRYHERFQSYPILQKAVANKELDLVYLDTTYSHPKHDFVPQEEAVEAIASQTEQLLSNDSTTTTNSGINTLVLLSCYSIGKEKVLWEASKRTNQLVYVNERKWRMLQCVQGHASEEVSANIIQRCTQNPSASSVHVIPMGLAGEMWPYFRPNFQKCADYVEKLERKYDKVVAFLPTGWANASKWNREHAINKKQVTIQSNKNTTESQQQVRTVEVEIRLMAYSEHSAFSELISFVQYLRPRKVVPTVFSDDNDCRKIENRFRNLLDTTRAKKAFFQCMTKNPVVESAPNKLAVPVTDLSSTSNHKQQEETKRPENCVSLKTEIKLLSDEDADSDVEIIEVDSSATIKEPMTDDKIGVLVAMGFDTAKARQCLKDCRWDLDSAIEVLLQQSRRQQDSVVANQSLSTISNAEFQPLSKRRNEETPSPIDKSELSTSSRKKPRSSPSSLITAFFTKKSP